MNTKQQLEEYLKDLPSKWRDQLVSVLCQIQEDKAVPTCAEVKECETITTLSNFSVSGTTVSIIYKDEKGVSFTRSFDVSQILDDTLIGLDPQCLATQSEWDELTYAQRIQLLIDSHCECCD